MIDPSVSLFYATKNEFVQNAPVDIARIAENGNQKEATLNIEGDTYHLHFVDGDNSRLLVTAIGTNKYFNSPRYLSATNVQKMVNAWYPPLVTRGEVEVINCLRLKRG